MLKQVEQCYGVHNTAGSNPIAAITLLPAILKQHKIAAGNVKAEQCYGIAPVRKQHVFDQVPLRSASAHDGRFDVRNTKQYVECITLKSSISLNFAT